MASALVMQCSPSWAMKTHTLEGWPIYWVHQPVKGMKHWMKWCGLREYKWNEYVTIAVNRNLSNCENSRKKKIFGASTGFEPVASALAMQCSPSWAIKTHTLEGWPIYWVHQPVKGMKHWMKWCELREYNCYFRNCLNCDSLRWSHTHFICIPAVHIISFSVSFLSRVDELSKLTSLPVYGSS